MNDLPGRGDVNPYGIPMPIPHEREGPEGEHWICPTCGENPAPKGMRCWPCRDAIEYDRLERESNR